MTDWIDRLAEAMGVPPLTAAETDRLLQAARDVAHRVERRVTPLSTFLLGMGLATRMSAGSSYEAAFEDVLEALLRRLPDEPTEEQPEEQDMGPAGEDG